jgi:heat shock protein HslJ
MRLVFLAVPLLLVLAACGAQSGDVAGSPPPDPLRGRTFIATSVTDDGKPRDLVGELSIEFTDDGRLIARAGCNMLQGQVETTGGRLVVDELGSTDMGCDQARLDQDAFVSGVLSNSPLWELAGDRLTITSGGTSFDMAPRESVHPDRDLVGTSWELDTLVDGQTASSGPSGAPPVTLVFDGKKVTADTHCNGVRADYTVQGDTIEFTLGMMTMMACAPEIMQGESAVVQVLDGTAKYEITADRLTLSNESGKGIQLHAK